MEARISSRGRALREPCVQFNPTNSSPHSSVFLRSSEREVQQIYAKIVYRPLYSLVALQVAETLRTS